MCVTKINDQMASAKGIEALLQLLYEYTRTESPKTATAVWSGLGTSLRTANVPGNTLQTTHDVEVDPYTQHRCCSTSA